MSSDPFKVEVNIAWPAGKLAGTLIFTPAPPTPPGPVASILLTLDPPGPRHSPGPVASTLLTLDPPGPRQF